MDTFYLVKMDTKSTETLFFLNIHEQRHRTISMSN